MFASRDRREGFGASVVVAFTDKWGPCHARGRALLDLSGEPSQGASWASVSAALGADRIVAMRQVHGGDVVRVTTPLPSDSPVCDALVTTLPGVALCVRMADCVPVVLADVAAGVAGVAHAGRRGIVAGIIGSAVEMMRQCGADRIEAWLGPHICGSCYEVPAALRSQVCDVAPAAFSCTTWGTPALNLRAAAVAQLVVGGCAAVNESAACTRETPDLFSYRREASSSGRLGGLVVLSGPPAPRSSL